MNGLKILSIITISLLKFYKISSLEEENTDCYDVKKQAKICMPPFINAAYRRRVNVTNTCGMSGQEEFCFQSGAGAPKSVCDICDNKDKNKNHPPKYMTDYNFFERKTWWQSQTLEKFDTLDKMEVNITLNLGTQFKITYININFKTPRPAAMAIYKKSTDTSHWEPMQFFSLACMQWFNMPQDQPLMSETDVGCISKYSQTVPLSGGKVTFSTLENRPNSHEFLNNQKLKDFVTASRIRIQLKRVNSFGDEQFGNILVKRTYFYAITDISIGGRCNCNGHASLCTLSNGLGPGETKLYCNCEHKTTGQNCDKCLPGYHDQPWRSATLKNAHECKRCQCNGNTDQCYFDKDLYDRSSGFSGGHCINCKNNTEGPHCERCKLGFFKQKFLNYCIPCICNAVGSVDAQCSTDGQCNCKPGVSGAKCDRCADDHFEFGPGGCKPCNCNQRGGGVNNKATCDSQSGECHCKENVVGKTCDKCRIGYVGLSLDDPLGCQPCFCYGHSTSCGLLPIQYSYEKRLPLMGWKIIDQDRVVSSAEYKDLDTQYPQLPPFIKPTSYVLKNTKKIIYYSVPDPFLGNQKNSYNQLLKVNLSMTASSFTPFKNDIIIESGSMSIRAPFPVVQTNSKPNEIMTFKIRLNENQRYRWNPAGISIHEFIGILSNITAIMIRATFDVNDIKGVGLFRLHQFSLETATDNEELAMAMGGKQTHTLENCDCQYGHIGRQCEKCAPGFRRQTENGGSFSKCIPCECNGHADDCEIETGRCNCKHHTAGRNCDICEEGYYGNATTGTPGDCKKCPCTKCTSDNRTGEPICSICPPGHTGNLCEECLDGFFQRPGDQFCLPCNCNGNVDPGKIGSCDGTTGACTRCSYNTAGDQCQDCKPGYYGNATALPKGQCKSCECNANGTYRDRNGQLQCDQTTGQCLCLSFVQNKRCDKCKPGYFGILRGRGCQKCRCKLPGSAANMCNPGTGQCPCKPGVSGRDCSRCKPLHYNLTESGCIPCRCSPSGSSAPTCSNTGQCTCKKYVEGIHCDRCVKSRYDIQNECKKKCPPCYDTIEERVDDLQQRLSAFKALMEGGPDTSTKVLNFGKFYVRLQDLTKKVDSLLSAVTGKGSIDNPNQLREMQEAAKKLITELSQITKRKTEIMETNGYEMVCDYNSITANLTLMSKNIIKTMKSIEDGLKYTKETFSTPEKFNADNKAIENLAKESRKIVKKRRNDVDAVMKELADLQKKLEDLRTGLQDINPTIDEQTRESNKAKTLLNEIERLSMEAATVIDPVPALVNDIYQKALNLLRQAENIGSPNSDVFIKDFEEIKSTAENLILKAKSLVTSAVMNQFMLKTKMDVAKKSLEKVKTGQKDFNLTATVLQQMFQRVTSVTNQIEKKKQQAEELKKTLQENDEEISKWKKIAEKATSRVIPIIMTVAKSNSELRKMKEELERSRNDVNGATTSIDNALKAAKSSEDENKKIKEAIDALQTRVTNETSNAINNNEESQNLKGTLDKNEKTIETQKIRAQFMSKTTANAAQTNDELKKDVEVSLNNIDSILKQLDEMTNVDPQTITDMENRLDSVDRNFSSEKISQRVKVLEEEGKKIDDEATKLMGITVNFEEEKKLLAEISNNLVKRECFKTGYLTEA